MCSKEKKFNSKKLRRSLSRWIKKAESATIKESGGCENERPRSWEEVVEIMKYTSLKHIDGAVVDVLFSEDKTRRCIITKASDGILSYSFEKLEAYDEEELCWLEKGAFPAYWYPYNGSGIFNDMDILMRELKAEPEYKIYFSYYDNE